MNLVSKEEDSCSGGEKKGDISGKSNVGVSGLSIAKECVFDGSVASTSKTKHARFRGGVINSLLHISKII